MAKKNSTTTNLADRNKIKRGVGGILTPSSDSMKEQESPNKILSQIQKALSGSMSDLISNGTDDILKAIADLDASAQELYTIDTSLQDLDKIAKSYMMRADSAKFFDRVINIDEGIKSLNKILYSKTTIDNYSSLSSTIQGNKSLVWYFSTIDSLVKMLQRKNENKEVSSSVENVRNVENAQSSQQVTVVQVPFKTDDTTKIPIPNIENLAQLLNSLSSLEDIAIDPNKIVSQIASLNALSDIDLDTTKIADKLNDKDLSELMEHSINSFLSRVINVAANIEDVSSLIPTDSKKSMQSIIEWVNSLTDFDGINVDSDTINEKIREIATVSAFTQQLSDSSTSMFDVVKSLITKANDIPDLKESTIGTDLYVFLDDFNHIAEVNIDAEAIKKNISLIVDSDILESVQKISVQLSRIRDVSNVPSNTIDSIAKWISEIDKLGTIKNTDAKDIRKKLAKLASGNPSLSDLIVTISSEIKKVDDLSNSAKPSSGVDKVTSVISDFITSLSTLSKGDPLKDIRKVKRSLSSLSDIAKPLGEIVDSLSKINTDTKKTQDIKSVLESVMSIGSLDGNGMKQSIDNLRKIKAMTEPHTVMSKAASMIGIGYKGIISDIIYNISALAKESSEEGDKNITILNKFLDLIASLGGGTFSSNSIEETQEALETVADMFEKSGTYTRLLEKIREFATNAESDEEQIRNAISFIGDGIITPMSKVASAIDKKNIANLQVGLLGYIVVGALLNAAVSQLAKTDTSQIAEVNGAISGLQQIIDSMSGIHDIDDAKSNVSALSSIMLHMILLGKMTGMAAKSMPDKGTEEISKSIIKYNDILESFTNIDGTAIDASTDKARELAKVVIGISLLNTFAAASIVSSAIAVPALWLMSKSVSILGKIVEAVNDIDDVDKQKEENLVAIGKIVAISSLILLGAGLVGNQIIPMIPGMLAFTATLSLFILGVVGAYGIASSQIEKTIDDADSFMTLVGMSACIMLLGGLIVTLYPKILLGALGFTAALAVFIGAVVGVYALASSSMKQSMEGVRDLTKLIVCSAAVLMIGAAFMTLVGIGPVMMFTAVLAGFVTAILGVYSLFSILLKGIGGMRIANELNMLVVASAASLVVGGLFMMIPGMAASTIKFGAILALFVGAVLATYAGASFLLGGRRGMKIARELNHIIVMSAATLIVGGLFMLIPGMPVATLEFAAILGTFVVAVSFGYAFASRIMGKKGALAAAMLSVLVTMSAVTLLAAGMLMMKYPDLKDNIYSFLWADLIFIAGMSGAVLLLSLIGWKRLLTGGIALGGIIGLIYLTGKAFGAINEAIKGVQEAGGWDEVWNFGKYAGAFIGSMAVMVGVLGGLIAGTGGIGFLVAGAGAAAMLAIIELISLTGRAVQDIAKAMKDLKEVKDFDFGTTAKNIGKFASLMGPLAEIAGPMQYLMIKSASANIKNISSAIGYMTEAIQGIASLSIPIYDENGKMIGRREMLPSEIDDAADNIAHIITCIAGAINDVYKSNPSLFEGAFMENFLGMDTPFSRVCKSCTNMGKMVTEISRGIKDMAQLKMPIYNGTKVVGYSQMKDADFVEASTNLGKIITTLASAIVSVYDMNPSLFVDESTWGKIFGGSASRTKFGIVMASASGIGRLVSSLARGIKDVAKLQIPIYKGTQVVGYETIKDSAFGEKGMVAKNISSIMTTIAGAIVSVYEKNSKMFEDPSAWYVPGNHSAFAMAVKSMRGVGELVSSMVKAIQDIINLKVPVYDGKGNIVKDQYRVLSRGDIAPGGRIFTYIEQVMTAMPRAINDVYAAHSEWFEDGEDSDMQKMYAACQGMSKFIGDEVKALTDITNLKFDVNSVVKNVYGVVSAIPKAIYTLLHIVDKNSKSGKDGINESMRDILTDTDMIDDIKNAYSNYGKAIGSAIKVYTDMSKMIQALPKQEGSVAPIDAIRQNIAKMMQGVSDVRTLISDEDIKFIDSSFVTSMTGYSKSIDTLKGAFTNFPTTIETDSASIANGVLTIEKAVQTIKTTDKFRIQTDNIQKFTKSINKLDLSRTESMTRMVQAIDQMASKLGGLDNLTHTIADELCKVLEHLTDQLKQSAYTIDKAEKIQKDRHKRIQDSIQKINGLLNNPVNVVVRQQDEKEKYDSLPDQSGPGQNSSSFGGSPSGSGSGSGGGGLLDSLTGFSSARGSSGSESEQKEKTSSAPKPETKGRPGNGKKK